jgi:hypothetical protein
MSTSRADRSARRRPIVAQLMRVHGNGAIRQYLVVAALSLAVLACAVPTTPPPSIVAIAELLKPAGVNVELLSQRDLSTAM